MTVSAGPSGGRTTSGRTSGRVVVVDTGLGNLRSVVRALEEAARREGVAASVEITGRPEDVARADKLVVPGQGAFRDCAAALEAGLKEPILESIRRGTPYLGLCLGLQVLFESSEEAEGCAGLGVMRGKVRRLAGGTEALTGRRLKIPHVGWNKAEPARPSRVLPEAAEYFYFVHSYVVAPQDASVVAATTEYGERFASAVERDNVVAVQFHPEKSQAAGLALLGRFVRS